MTSIRRREFLSAATLTVAGALAPRPGRAQTSVKVGTAVLGD
jgi:hypothetical protein